MKILEARELLRERERVFNEKDTAIKVWAGLLGDNVAENLIKWAIPTQVTVEIVNIAGANVPIYGTIHFPKAEYDYASTPFWVDSGIQELRLLMTYLAEMTVIKQQIEMLEKELRVTTQRVNLFEKVKIPECLNNVRVISIYLGDQQANAVGVSKVAKKKIEFKNLEAATA
jgi:V/A-type H+-transporting ATPase subunit D